MNKKYQIFISSTFEDLKEERRKVQDTILSMYQFPIGMEMFSAANEEQWEIIQETIDSSNYYVLIIGHKYGSVIEKGEYTGISYTQKEFRYALNKKIPILAFIMDDSVPVTPDKQEKNAEKIEKLNQFIQEIKTGRMVQWWTSADDLAAKVSVALTKEFMKGKRPGWIRNTNVSIIQNKSCLNEPEKGIIKESFVSNKETEHKLIIKIGEWEKYEEDLHKYRIKIEISDGGNYFIVVKNGYLHNIILVRNGIGIFTRDFESWGCGRFILSKLEIGRIYKFESPDDIGLDIHVRSKGNNGYHINEINKHSFMLIYDFENIINKKIDYHYEYVLDGELDIKADCIDESIHIIGAYVLNKNDNSIVKIDGEIEWDGKWGTQKLICTKRNIYGIGLIKITEDKRSYIRYFIIYDSIGYVEILDDSSYPSEYSFEIIAFTSKSNVDVNSYRIIY